MCFKRNVLSLAFMTRPLYDPAHLALGLFYTLFGFSYFFILGGGGGWVGGGSCFCRNAPNGRMHTWLPNVVYTYMLTYILVRLTTCTILYMRPFIGRCHTVVLKCIHYGDSARDTHGVKVAAVILMSIRTLGQQHRHRVFITAVACVCNNNNFSQVDEAVGNALARRVEEMVEELHKEEAELVREPPEGQEVRS